MNGQTTSKGLTSNYSSTGTISARGFVYKTGATSTEFLQGDSGVTNDVFDNNDTIGTFSKTLGSLSSSTTYSYRAYATNAAGTTYGAIETATTSSASSLQSFSSSVNSNFNSVCLEIVNQTYYHNGSGTFPTMGDTVYSLNDTSYPISAGYYRLDPFNSGNYIRTNSSGVVIAVESC